MSQRNRRSLGLPVAAKESIPKSPSEGPVAGLRKKYSNYLVFAEDPRLKNPFKVLPGTQISNIESCDNTHLDKLSVNLVTLHEVVGHLNDEFKMLLTCKVPMEDAYTTLLDNYSHKGQEGITYAGITDGSGEAKEGEAKTDTDNAVPSSGKKRRGQPKKCQSNVERPKKAQELKNPAPTAAISLKKPSPPEVVKDHREHLPAQPAAKSFNEDRRSRAALPMTSAAIKDAVERSPSEEEKSNSGEEDNNGETPATTSAGSINGVDRPPNKERGHGEALPALPASSTCAVWKSPTNEERSDGGAPPVTAGDGVATVSGNEQGSGKREDKPGDHSDDEGNQHGTDEYSFEKSFTSDVSGEAEDVPAACAVDDVSGSVPDVPRQDGMHEAVDPPNAPLDAEADQSKLEDKANSSSNSRASVLGKLASSPSMASNTSGGTISFNPNQMTSFFSTLLNEVQALRENQQRLWDRTTSGLTACRNAINDQTHLIRGLKHDFASLQGSLRDSKAVAANLPHADLATYIPFNSDADVITVLENTALNNALYAKATELKVDAPLFVQRFCDFMFTEDYRATRCYPSKLSRSPKTPMPEQIVGFFNTYKSKHIGDKMSEKVFMKGVTRAFTNATYKTTPIGGMKLAINAQQQKLRRRVVKIAALQKKIQELRAVHPPKATDATKLKRYEFELTQADDDKANLEEDIASLLEVLNKKKGSGEEKEDCSELAALHGVDLNEMASEAVSDEVIAGLGLDPRALDNQELHFAQL